MFDNSFCFLFSKTCFWEYKEKTIFLYFWNQKHVWLRLCLVAVKRFPENTYFPEKENVFMCLVAFQKNFRKIFSGVWKRRRKTQIRKHKSENTSHSVITITERSWSWRDRDRQCDRDPDCDQRRDRYLAFFARSRLTARSREDHDWRRDLAKIAIDGAISRRSRSRLREIAPRLARSRSRTGAGARNLGLELELAIPNWIFSSCALAHALSLSLSLSLSFSGNALKGK